MCQNAVKTIVPFLVQGKLQVECNIQIPQTESVNLNSTRSILVIFNSHVFQIHFYYLNVVFVVLNFL